MMNPMMMMIVIMMLMLVMSLLVMFILQIGIELDRAVGRNDGSISSVRYFECHPQHGLFTRRHVVHLLSGAHPYSALLSFVFLCVVIVIVFEVADCLLLTRS